MSKKILSVALALVLVMSTFALSAFAASKPAYEEDATAYTQAWRLEDASEGDVYKANIYLEAAYGVGAVQFKIESADKADLVAVDSDVFVGDYDINFSKEGLVFIVPTPAEGTESMDAIEFADETLIATLTFELAEGADSATVSIENDPKNEENPNGTLIAARVDDGNLVTGTSIVGQDATVDGSATFGAVAAPADLALTAAGSAAGIVIDTNKFASLGYAGVVYGFTQVNNRTFRNTDIFTTNLQVTNGGTYEFTKTEKGTYSTGAVITVKNADGTVGKKYVIVVFGDIDGSGTVTADDISLAVDGVASTARVPAGSVARLAANCFIGTNAKAMHNITGDDIALIVSYAGGNKFQTPPIATKHSTYNNFYK